MNTLVCWLAAFGVLSASAVVSPIAQASALVPAPSYASMYTAGTVAVTRTAPRSEPVYPETAARLWLAQQSSTQSQDRRTESPAALPGRGSDGIIVRRTATPAVTPIPHNQSAQTHEDNPPVAPDTYPWHINPNPFAPAYPYLPQQFNNQFPTQTPSQLQPSDGYYYWPNNLIIQGGGDGSDVVFGPGDTITDNSGDGSSAFDDGWVAGSSLAPSLKQSLSDISRAWKTGSFNPIDRHLGTNGQLKVSTNGKVETSIGASDYAAGMRNAMSDVTTVGFRFTRVVVKPNGDAVAMAVQKYRSQSGSIDRTFPSYTLRPDSSLLSGYRLIAVGVSNTPLDAR